MKTLKEQKIESKKAWEKTFKKSINDSLTKEGLKKFWDNETSLDEAVDMLTCAAINDIIGGDLKKAINNISNNKVGVLVIGLGDDDDKDEEESKECTEHCEGPGIKKEGMFKVVNLTTKHIYDDGFCSAEEAQDFIKETCMNTHYSISEFGIVQEMV